MNSTVATPAKAETVSQPQAAIQMNLMSPPVSKGNQVHHEHQQKAQRLRGGGAGKDCFIGLFGCFVCFECCEGCCDCVADIICCPCEMCC